MQKNAVHKASDLSPEQKRVVEALLGNALQEDESISLRTFQGQMIQAAPAGQAREDAFRRLQERIERTARRGEGVPEDEIDAAIDEAAGYVRRHPE